MEEKENKLVETGTPGDFGEIEAINFTISEQQVINEALMNQSGIWKTC